jgi:RNA polymerase sigma factor for flagellar operon FliA
MLTQHADPTFTPLEFQIPNTAPLARTLAQRNALVTEHLQIVKAAARYIRASLPAEVSIDDLVQTGTFGLIHAAERYDPTLNVSFTQFAKLRIRGAMLDSLRTSDSATRGERHRMKAIERTKRSLESTFHRQPTDQEIGSALGLSTGDVRQANMARREFRSLSSAFDSSTKEEFIPELASAESTPEDKCLKKSRQQEIRRMVRTLPRRDRTVVLLYYVGELTMRDIAQRLGVNESRVSQIHKGAIAKLRDMLVTNRTTKRGSGPFKS